MMMMMMRCLATCRLVISLEVDESLSVETDVMKHLWKVMTERRSVYIRFLYDDAAAAAGASACDGAHCFI